MYPLSPTPSNSYTPRQQYPDTRRDDTVDTYHGVEVPDPYRWLEDPYADETVAWVEAQNKVTNEILEGLPTRAALKERLTEVFNYERFSCPSKKGNRYFFRKNDGLQNQSVLYKQDSLDSKEEVLLDPNVGYYYLFIF